ncbi:MAG: polyhydroxyalkanoic acid system family protein [Myxococcota bacterium]
MAQHDVPHDLSFELAKKATEKAFAAYAARFEEYAPTAEWTSERHADVSFTVKGMTLKGALDIKESAIGMELDVPFIFKPFRKKALEIIEREVVEWIAKAKNGELDGDSSVD